ncbi:MAG TPA: choice-of-anchor D domain-containing protein [Candidatus Saccharimonadia bacterium]|nr:choice-of-anchor D domain-containing protein [Candidatus Saccharimonadia bacterium]
MSGSNVRFRLARAGLALVLSFSQAAVAAELVFSGATLVGGSIDAELRMPDGTRIAAGSLAEEAARHLASDRELFAWTLPAGPLRRVDSLPADVRVTYGCAGPGAEILERDAAGFVPAPVDLAVADWLAGAGRLLWRPEAPDAGACGAANPGLAVSPSPIVFAPVAPGTVADRTASVRSTGTIAVRIERLEPPAAPFALVSDTCSGRTLEPSQSCEVTIRFEPSVAGTFVANLGVRSNDAMQALTPVSLEAVAVELPDLVFVAGFED